MTQTARHIQLAERYLQTAASLQSGGYNNEAAEMVWGAIVNAIESIGHLDTGNSNRNLSNKARRDLTRKLSATIFAKYQDSQIKLHDHFYHDTLNESDFQYYIARGRAYAQELIEMALQRQSPQI